MSQLLLQVIGCHKPLNPDPQHWAHVCQQCLQQSCTCSDVTAASIQLLLWSKLLATLRSGTVDYLIIYNHNQMKLHTTRTSLPTIINHYLYHIIIIFICGVLSYRSVDMAWFVCRWHTKLDGDATIHGRHEVLFLWLIASSREIQHTQAG